MDRYQKNGLPHFLIFELNSGKFVGRCGFRPNDSGEVEVGYGFHKEYWEQGFATETLEALFSFARKNISVDHIIAFTSINHLASQRVMEKCGMQYIKTEILEGEECKFYKKELIDHPQWE
jgi:[ribosomal protein S5]-alanine N-acetyltransferase